jgi:hypothetical protein
MDAYERVRNTPTLSPRPAPEPKSLVLVTTVYTCECGKVYRTPNPNILVRYTDNVATHYRRQDLGNLASLTREHKLVHWKVPYCEACFDPQ